MTTLRDALARADASAVAGQLDEVSAEELLASLHATSDRELEGLLDEPALAGRLASVLLDRAVQHPSGHRAERAGVVGLELAQGGAVVVDRSFAVADTTARDVDGVDEWDVILRTTVLHFVRMASGVDNAALLAVAGELEIDGDAALALDFAGIVAQHEDAAVDPMALDPSEVGAAVKRATDEQLHSFMSTSARDVVLCEVFRRFPDFVDKRKIRGLDAVIVFRLAGDPETSVRYTARFADGVCTTTAGESDDRTATIMMDAADFLKLATGNLNPVKAGLRGKISVKGDKAAVLAMNRAIDPPKPRR